MNVAAAAALRIAKVGFLGDSILREAIISYFLAHQRAPALCPPTIRGSVNFLGSNR